MIRRSLIVAATALVAIPFSASAQSETHGFSIDLFGAYVRPFDADGFHTEAYGLRGAFRFSPAWALEGSVSRLNEDTGVYFGDFSIKAYFVHSSLFEIYALAGSGAFRVPSEDVRETTVHLGIGAEIPFGERFYLRPEARGRWGSDELKLDEGIADYSLGVGWRF